MAHRWLLKLRGDAVRLRIRIVTVPRFRRSQLELQLFLSPFLETTIGITRSIWKAGICGGVMSEPFTEISVSALRTPARFATPPGRTSWKTQRTPSEGVSTFLKLAFIAFLELMVD